MPENMATNPKAKNGINGFVSFAGTGGTNALSWQTTGGPTINGTVFNYVRATWSVASTGGTPYIYHGTTATSSQYNIPVTPNSYYSYSLWVRSNVARSVTANVYSYNSAGANVETDLGTAVALTANTWTQVTVSNKQITNSAAVTMLALLTATGTFAIGDTLEVTGYVIVQDVAAPTTYWDGDSANAVWTSANGDSSSTLFNDYTYMFKNNGAQINDQATVPFIDVDKVTGLDLPELDANIDDIDAAHGGTARVRFTKVRTIVVEGTIYADPQYVELYVDQLMTNFMPDDTNYPFYFKHPGVGLRYCNAKTVSLKMDIDTMRRIGSSPIQIQLVCEDPRKYIDNADQVMVSGTNYTPANPGNINTYPIFTIVGAMASITLTNNTQARSVTLTRTTVAGDITVIDFRKRTVTVNGVNVSNSLTAANWWDIPAGGGQTVKWTGTGGPPTSVTMSTKQGWM